MSAYISISNNKRKELISTLNAITDTLKANNIEPFIFIDNYEYDAQQENQMMLQAMEDIDKSDLLIAETSEKAIGIGIEAGYAKATHKPVIYLRHIASEHSTTHSGISDYQVIYENELNLQMKLGDANASIIMKIK